MSEKIVALKNEHGEVRSVNVGYSVWTVFFGWLAAAILGSPACAAILLIVHITLYVFVGPFGGFIMGTIVDIIVAGLVGPSIARRFIDKGFKPINERSREILASCGIEAEAIKETPTAPQEMSVAHSTPQPEIVTMEELNSGPKDAHAYISKMTVELGLTEEADLAAFDKPLAEYRDFQKALFFADEAYKKVLEGYAKSVDENIALKNREEKYQEASLFQRNSEYEKASELFKQLGDYKDSEQLAEECVNLQQKADERAAAERVEEEEREKVAAKFRTKGFTIVACVIILAAIVLWFREEQRNKAWRDVWTSVVSGTKAEVEKTINAWGAPKLDQKNNNNETLLLVAAKNNPNLDVIETLIKAGADVNAKDKGGISIVDILTQKYPLPKVVQLLVNVGKISAKNSELAPILMGKKLNARYSELAQMSSDDEISTMAAIGVDFNKIIPFDETRAALFTALAVKTQNPEMITTMVKTGANVHNRDEKWGRTALHWVASNGSNPEILRALVKAGADVNSRATRDSQATALFHAAQNNSNLKMVDTLLDLGADAKIPAIGNLGGRYIAVDYLAKNSTYLKGGAEAVRIYQRLKAATEKK